MELNEGVKFISVKNNREKAIEQLKENNKSHNKGFNRILFNILTNIHSSIYVVNTNRIVKGIDRNNLHRTTHTEEEINDLEKDDRPLILHTFYEDMKGDTKVYFNEAALLITDRSNFEKSLLRKIKLFVLEF